MASKSISGTTGTKENGLIRSKDGHENELKSGSDRHPGNSPSSEGPRIVYDGPKDHVSILEYYFGQPSASRW